MSRKKRAACSTKSENKKPNQVSNDHIFGDLIKFVLPDGVLFSKDEFHGNIKWVPEQLAAQALIWSWQDSKNVTDGFAITLEICKQIGLKNGAKTYTGFMNALDRYRGLGTVGIFHC